jgi:hypothetical protein
MLYKFVLLIALSLIAVASGMGVGSWRSPGTARGNRVALHHSDVLAASW